MYEKTILHEKKIGSPEPQKPLLNAEDNATLNNSRFKKYNISVNDFESIKTFDALLSSIFSSDIDETQYHISEIILNEPSNPKELTLVDERFLLHLAYGIQGVEEYNADITPGLIKKQIHELVQLYPQRQDAAQYFLKHFNTVTQNHGKNTSRASIGNYSPQQSDTPIDFFPTFKKGVSRNKQINAMSHDLSLFNRLNFMEVMSNYINKGLPIPDVNCITTGYNLLNEKISTDILSAQDDQVLLKEKIKIYLKVAQILLTDKLSKDPQSAGIISLVFTRHQDFINKTLPKEKKLNNKINKLSQIFQPNANFKQLRAIVGESGCILPFWVMMKDIIISKENIFWNKIIMLGKQYYNLANQFIALQSILDNHNGFNPNYLTNIPTIFELKVNKSERKASLLSQNNQRRHSVHITSSEKKEITPMPSSINSPYFGRGRANTCIIQTTEIEQAHFNLTPRTTTLNSTKSDLRRGFFAQSKSAGFNSDVRMDLNEKNNTLCSEPMEEFKITSNGM
jgi:hypothetical protein